MIGTKNATSNVKGKLSNSINVTDQERFKRNIKSEIDFLLGLMWQDKSASGLIENTFKYIQVRKYLQRNKPVIRAKMR